MGNNNYKLGSDFFYDFLWQKREEYFGLSNKKSPKYPYSIICGFSELFSPPQNDEFSNPSRWAISLSRKIFRGPYSPQRVENQNRRHEKLNSKYLRKIFFLEFAGSEAAILSYIFFRVCNREHKTMIVLQRRERPNYRVFHAPSG